MRARKGIDPSRGHSGGRVPPAARGPLLLPLLLALTPAPALAQKGEAFVPAAYERMLEARHQAGEDVLEVQKITGQVENLSTGKVAVTSVTQVLDCKTGKLLSQRRCNPCEYNIAEWPRRPTDRWFAERSWTTGAEVSRRKAEMEMAHLRRYFKLERMDGVEHQGLTYAFWAFDGRRGTPLVEHPRQTVKVAKTVLKSEKPKYGPVQKIEIFQGPNKPDEIDAPAGGGALHLRAVAYAAPVGQSVLSEVDTFTPLWSTSCARLSSTSAKEVVVTLEDDADRCTLHLYEGRTGVEDRVTIVRHKKKPKVRVVITFEGGKEADGVVLKGDMREIELEAHAFDPAGQPLPEFRPEWGIACGKVEFLDGPAHRRLRLHLDAGVTRCEVHARETKSGAEDVFMIEVHE